MDPHRLAEARSLAYHRVIAPRLAADARWLEIARARLTEWEARRLIGAEYLATWRALLDGPLDRLLAILLEDSEASRALRQTTPFAGVLDPRERWSLFRAVRDRASLEPA